MKAKGPTKSNPHARVKRSAGKGGPHATRKAVAKPRKRKRATRRTWQQIFLASLAHTPNVAKACDRAGIDDTTPYHYRDDHPEFGEQWKRALDRGVQRTECSLWERGTDGVKEPVYQGGYRVGWKQVYDTQAAMFMLRAHKPDTYRERLDVTVIEKKAQLLAKAFGLEESDIAEVLAVARRLRGGLEEKGAVPL